MILQPSNNALSPGSNNLGSNSSFVPKNINVSSSELASVSFNPSVNVELSSSKLLVSTIPPIYSKPTVYSSNENQFSPSRLSSSSEALAENAILSKPSVSSAGKIEEGNSKKGTEESVEKKKGEPSSASFELSEDEIKMSDELKSRDLEVRAHEQAHKSVGGQYTGAISYSYQAGPDGKRYAVGGEVPIDVSPIAGDPQATITKMTIVSAAATAPAKPSAQDQMVAIQAARTISEAQAELAQKKYEEASEVSEEKKERLDSNSSTDSSTPYASNSLDTFQSIAQKDQAKVNLVDTIV